MDNREIIVITDANGFIAGMQAAVPFNLTLNDEWYNFRTSPYYLMDKLLGDYYFFSTAYFVAPETICTGGRTQAQFEEEGTGNRLALQTGPYPAEYFLTDIPRDEGELERKVTITQTVFNNIF